MIVYEAIAALAADEECLETIRCEIKWSYLGHFMSHISPYWLCPFSAAVVLCINVSWVGW